MHLPSGSRPACPRASMPGAGVQAPMPARTHERTWWGAPDPSAPTKPQHASPPLCRNAIAASAPPIAPLYACPQEGSWGTVPNVRAQASGFRGSPFIDAARTPPLRYPHHPVSVQPTGSGWCLRAYSNANGMMRTPGPPTSAVAHERPGHRLLVRRTLTNRAGGSAHSPRRPLMGCRDTPLDLFAIGRTGRQGACGLVCAPTSRADAWLPLCTRANSPRGTPRPLLWARAQRGTEGHRGNNTTMTCPS